MARPAISTTDFIARFTEGGVALATTAGGACVFLGEGGCGVHPDRPVACRLYPLGRVAGAGGAELFVELEPHPQSEGVYGEDGTVGNFLASQGVEPFLRAADLYYDALLRLSAALGAGAAATPPELASAPPEPASTLPEPVSTPPELAATPPDPAVTPSEPAATPPEPFAGRDDDAGTAAPAGFLDMDVAVAIMAERDGVPVPTDPEDKLGLHLRYLALIAAEGLRSA